MFEFFNSVMGYIETVFDFLISIVEALISFLGIIPTALALPLALVEYVPLIIGTSITAVLGTQVVKLIIGR